MVYVYMVPSEKYLMIMVSQINSQVTDCKPIM